MNANRFDKMRSRVVADYQAFRKLTFFQVAWELHKAGLVIASFFGLFYLIGWRELSGVGESVGAPGEGPPLGTVLLIIGFLVSGHLGLIVTSLHYCVYTFSDMELQFQNLRLEFDFREKFKKMLPVLRCSFASLVTCAIPIFFCCLTQYLVCICEQYFAGGSIVWRAFGDLRSIEPITVTGYWFADILFVLGILSYGLLLRREARLSVILRN